MLVPHPKAWSPNLALAWCPLWRASACARLPAAAEMAGLPCVLIVYRRGSRETHYGPKLLIHLIKSILVLNCAARTKIFILLRSCEGSPAGGPLLFWGWVGAFIGSDHLSSACAGASECIARARCTRCSMKTPRTQLD